MCYWWPIITSCHSIKAAKQPCCLAVVDHRPPLTHHSRPSFLSQCCLIAGHTRPIAVFARPFSFLAVIAPPHRSPTGLPPAPFAAQKGPITRFARSLGLFEQLIPPCYHLISYLFVDTVAFGHLGGAKLPPNPPRRYLFLWAL